MTCIKPTQMSFRHECDILSSFYISFSSISLPLYVSILISASFLWNFPCLSPQPFLLMSLVPIQYCVFSPLLLSLSSFILLPYFFSLSLSLLRPISSSTPVFMSCYLCIFLFTYSIWFSFNEIGIVGEILKNPLNIINILLTFCT